MSEGMETRILAAAIACLERKGVAGTGIREIASEAGVNSAAISYYFRSKDNLLQKALAQTLDQAFAQVPADLERLEASGLDARAAFEHLIANYLFRAAQYPRLTFANLHDVLSEQRYTAPAASMVQALLDMLTEKLTATFPHRSREALRLGLGQIWAAMLSWAMAPMLFASVDQFDFKSQDQCLRWAKQMISVLDSPHANSP